MNKLDVKQVVLLHELMINQIGGLQGVRDAGLLDSAVNGIYQTFGGQELYSTIEEKAARLGYSLISNHVFVDGNKRVGVLAMLTFLEINNVKIQYTDQEIINIGFGVATGNLKSSDLHNWICSKKDNIACK